MANETNLANQKAREALRCSAASSPRNEWGDQYGFISGRVNYDGSVECLYLSHQGFEAFEEAVDRLLKVDNFEQAVGRHAIISRLSDFLRKRDGQVPKYGFYGEFMREVVDPLRQSIQEWICYVPLINFLVNKPTAVGSVIFLSKEAAYDELRSTNATSDAGRWLEETKIAGDEERVDAFAKTTVAAHEMQRVRLAEESVLIVINMLRAFGPSLNSFNFALLCGLRTEVPRNETHSVLSIHPVTGDIDVRHDSDDSVTGNFFVREDTLQQLRDECEFDTLAAIAAKPPASRTTLETAVFVSVQALGQSMVLGSRGPAFSGCIAALECLALLAETKVKIKETFAANLATLFRGYAKAERAYALRSEFVHTGFASIDVEDLRFARNCAIAAIVMALSESKSISEHADFLSQCLSSTGSAA